MRRYDNDWLTILATLVVFLFHSARFFNEQDWHVKNIDVDVTFTLFTGIIEQWIMPLFFLLSGMSSFFSLQSRSITAYITNRILHVAVPFLFSTFVVIVPLQVWLERVYHGQFEGSFWAFYPHYFDGWYLFGGNFAWMGLHLWYLGLLFLLTFATLPLFKVLQRLSYVKLDGALLASPLMLIMLMAIPLFAIEWGVGLFPEGVGSKLFGGWSILTYLLFFVLGYLMANLGSVNEAIARLLPLSILLALLLSALKFFILPAWIDTQQLDYTLKIALRSFNTLFWLLALLGLAHRYLTMSNRLLSYGRKAVLPFYILHQSVIVAIGFMISTIAMPLYLKYPLLVALSFLAIMGIYSLIRQSRVLMFLFGSKR
jgi:glucan biosynthesis protein C